MFPNLAEILASAESVPNATDRPNGTAFALNLSDELSGEGYSSATLPGEAKFGSEPSLHVRGNNFADTWVHFI